MVVKMVWSMLRALGPMALKISAGRPSIPDALLICLIAFLTSSRVRGKIKVICNCLMWNQVQRSRVNSRRSVSSLEKCSLHHSMMLSLSLSKAITSEETKVWCWDMGGNTQLSIAKELFEVIAVLPSASLFCQLSCIFQFPLGFALQVFEMVFL